MVFSLENLPIEIKVNIAQWFYSRSAMTRVGLVSKSWHTICQPILSEGFLDQGFIWFPPRPDRPTVEKLVGEIVHRRLCWLGRAGIPDVHVVLLGQIGVGRFSHQVFVASAPCSDHASRKERQKSLLKFFSVLHNVLRLTPNS